jgi:hypothetical protein
MKEVISFNKNAHRYRANLNSQTRWLNILCGSYRSSDSDRLIGVDVRPGHSTSTTIWLVQVYNTLGLKIIRLGYNLR